MKKVIVTICPQCKVKLLGYPGQAWHYCPFCHIKYKAEGIDEFGEGKKL